MISPRTVLLSVFLCAQFAAFFVLAWRGWWQRFPGFMVALALACLQALTGAVGQPHTLIWWRYTWTPVEYFAVLATCAAAAECIWQRTRCLDPMERFSCRFAPDWKSVVE